MTLSVGHQSRVLDPDPMHNQLLTISRCGVEVTPFILQLRCLNFLFLKGDSSILSHVHLKPSGSEAVQA